MDWPFTQNIFQARGGAPIGMIKNTSRSKIHPTEKPLRDCASYISGMNAKVLRRAR
ncbi:MAG: hypothetical protein SFW66_00795 [Gammaproteobacteria bacterium]|nr:hypothetical protein [Gammaproteobacteria bacterium]